MSQGILIIEDEAVLAKNIDRYMRGHGYDVQVAASGEQGLRQFKEFKPDLVLLDFSLPGKDGLEILRSLRQLDPQGKVILITGHGNVQRAVAHELDDAAVVLGDLGVNNFVAQGLKAVERTLLVCTYQARVTNRVSD